MRTRVCFMCWCLIGIFALTAVLQAGEETDKMVYHPKADASAQLNAAIKRAGENNKHVLLVIGGNWCSWCMKLDRLFHADETVSKLLADNYELLHVNYSPENKNLKVLERLDYPQRFGFPVLVVLDGQGHRLHTQNSGYLEKDKGHGPKKVADFLKHWTPAAINPQKYQ